MKTDTKPLMDFFVTMNKHNESVETFSQALTIIGILDNGGDMNKVDMLLREMDTSPREYLMEALEASGFQI